MSHQAFSLGAKRWPLPRRCRQYEHPIVQGEIWRAVISGPPDEGQPSSERSGHIDSLRATHGGTTPAWHLQDFNSKGPSSDTRGEPFPAWHRQDFNSTCPSSGSAMRLPRERQQHTRRRSYRRAPCLLVPSSSSVQSGGQVQRPCRQYEQLASSIRGDRPANRGAGATRLRSASERSTHALRARVGVRCTSVPLHALSVPHTRQRLVRFAPSKSVPRGTQADNRASVPQHTLSQYPAPRLDSSQASQFPGAHRPSVPRAWILTYEPYPRHAPPVGHLTATPGPYDYRATPRTLSESLID